MAWRTAILSAALAAALLGGAGASPAGAQPPAPSPAAPPATPAQPPGAPAPATPEPAAAPGAQRPLDIVVTVTMATGRAETFAREVGQMEIITLPDGRIDMVHLILVADGERNTHVWYNFSRVAKLSYRFFTAEGRAKVQVRVVQPSPPARELTERLEPLSPSEYR